MRKFFSFTLALSMMAQRVDAVSFEIMPIVGFETHTKHDLAGPRNDRMDLRNVAVRGLSAAYITGDGQVELLYTRANSAAEIQQSEGAPPDRFDVKVETFLFNGLRIFSREQHIQPFVSFGIGGTKYTPIDSTRSSTLKPSAAIGTGFKWLWTDRIGLRFDARWMPTFAPSGAHFFCDSSGNDCYALEDNGIFTQRLFLNNYQLTSGLLLRF